MSTIDGMLDSRAGLTGDMTGGLTRLRVPDVAALVDTSGPGSLVSAPTRPGRSSRTDGRRAASPSPPALYMMMNCVLASWRRGRMFVSVLLRPRQPYHQQLKPTYVTSSQPITDTRVTRERA